MHDLSPFDSLMSNQDQNYVPKKSDKDKQKENKRKQKKHKNKKEMSVVACRCFFY